jgi:acetyltransferase-like isoleucine patch superfamily enzyme
MPNYISESAKICQYAIIETSSRGSNLHIGEHCFIDDFVKIKFSGGIADIEIGDYCYLNAGTILYSGNGIKLGKAVLIAANVTLAPTNHNIAKDKWILHQGFMESKGGIIIEDDVWIGANSVILDGTYIEEGCIIAAGSVVRGRIEKYGIYGGNPLKRLKDRI